MSHSRAPKNLLVMLAITGACACDPPSPDHPPEPVKSAPNAWKHESEANYTLSLPGTWRPLSKQNAITNGADLTVRHDDRLLMVIPVEIPEELHDSMPPLQTFKRESVAQLTRDVPEFKKLSEDNISLAGTPATMISASGKINEIPSHYLITYVQRAGWRYQIVAWTHAAHAAELSREIDPILSTWAWSRGKSSALTKEHAGQRPPRD